MKHKLNMAVFIKKKKKKTIIQIFFFFLPEPNLEDIDSAQATVQSCIDGIMGL